MPIQNGSYFSRSRFLRDLLRGLHGDRMLFGAAAEDDADFQPSARVLSFELHGN